MQRRCHAFIHAKGRDNARTPMQWDGSKNAGFTVGEPWLKVNPNYLQINAAEECNTADSVFAYYKALIALRKSIRFLPREITNFLWGMTRMYLPIREHGKSKHFMLSAISTQRN